MRLQCQGATSLCPGKSSPTSSSGHGSIISERSLDDLKVIEENDLSEFSPRSLMSRDRPRRLYDDMCNRDSGFDQPNLNNHDADDGKCQSPVKQQASNGLSQTPVEPSLLPEELRQMSEIQNRSSAADSVERSSDTLCPSTSCTIDNEDLSSFARPDIETSPVCGNGASSITIMNGEERVTTPSTPEPISTPTASSSSNAVGTDGFLTAAPICEATVADVLALETSTNEQFSPARVKTNSPKSSLSATLSSPETSYSTHGQQKPSDSSLTSPTCLLYTSDAADE